MYTILLQKKSVQTEYSLARVLRKFEENIK